MDFQEKLESIKQRIEGNLPPSYLQIMHKATDDLEKSGIQNKVLKVGRKAPAFQLFNQNGEAVSSEELLSKGMLVLTFYRGVWCPYCNADLANLKKYLPEIEENGATLLGVSPELPQFLRKISDMQKLNFDILHDAKNGLAAQFGLKFFYPEDLKELYRDKFNINLEVQQGNDEWALPMPARFIIDQEGIIRYSESKADYRNRPNPDELISVLKNLKSQKSKV
ncbi:peroxiredoxin-like family protein [Luteibaculum oceani]|uniref:thioredoxin-dependent peroxiredoxin n=1 Tax=Luteibaculum oceani TaxID=1294296 RepID=A0A5C6UZJ9_9FLAO|nr:peroxiredoxin-like family protein [Luteibaculum oceani]TXC78697.1 AhpC/TSA family protein [Luteibaculum oceani]